MCLGTGFGCRPPFLAGVCGSCGWAWVLACHPAFLAGFWACVVVCALCLYPAVPGSGVPCGCVPLGSGFRCAPPLLAGPLGCVCVCVRTPFVPGHSLLGCASWVCVLELVFQLRPATPCWGVGVCVCLVHALLAPRHSWLGCAVWVCAWARVSAAPRHSWLGCWGVYVLACPLRSYPTTLGLGVRCRSVCLGSGFSCAPPRLAGVCACLCARSAWLPATPGSGLQCRCVCWGRNFGLRPATPGSGFGVCVSLCACSPCTPPLLAGVCGVGVCPLALVSAAPRHSWLGCWGVCVFVCALRLYRATPGWGVRRGCVPLGSGLDCALPPLPGVLGSVCVCVRALLVPRHSWLGCAVWVCALWLWFWLLPATPGWGARVCVCLCARSACYPPLLAGVFGCVCVCVRAPLVPRQSWLGSAVWVCVFGLGFRLRPATPCWGAGVCVCLCARSACTPPLPAGMCVVGVCVWARVSAPPSHSWRGCWGVCAFVCALRLYPATPGSRMRCVCVCLGSDFGRAPPLLARLLGCLCVCVRAPLVPHHSWLGCAVWVCVFGRESWLRPATPGLVVGVCVCVFVRAPLVSRHSRLVALCGLGCAWHLSLCRGSLQPVRAARVCGTRWPLLLGTCLCALVLAGGVHLWRTWWPHSGAPRVLRSARSQCSGWLSQRRGAFPHPRGLCPRIYWAAVRGTWRPAENRAQCACPWPLPRQRRWACSASYPFRGPAMGLVLAGPSGVGLGLRALRWFACEDPVTDVSSFPYRLSFDRGLGRCTGAVSCRRRHCPFRVGGCHARVPCVCACACLLGRVGRAGLPGRVLVRLTSSCGRSRTSLCLLGPLQAGVVLLVVVPAFSLCLFCAFLVSGIPIFLALGALGLGVLWSLVPLFLVLISFSPPPGGFFCFLFFFVSFVSFFSFFLFSSVLSFFFSCRRVLFLRCWAGVCCCGGCASDVASVRLRSVVQCSLPVPSPFVLWLVELHVPGGAVLVVLLFPMLPLVGPVWCCPPPPPSAALCACFSVFPLLVGLVLVNRPPLAGCGVLRCALSCVVSCGAAVCSVFCVVLAVVRPACVGLGSCAVLLGAVFCFVFLCCSCCALLSCAAALSALSYFLRCSLPFRGAPGRFCFCAPLVRCCAAVPALLLSVRFPLAPAALAGVLCCRLLCLPVCCLAWLSSVVSWQVLVAPGVVFRCCAVVRLWVLCCAVLLRVVPPGVVLLCAVLFRFAQFGAVAPSVVFCGAVRHPGVLCSPALCFVLSLRAVCVLPWCVAAWCHSPLCFVPSAS